MKTLITVVNLMDLLKTKNCLVIDTRFSLSDSYAGKVAYQRGHIPGAIFLDMEKDLSGPIIPGLTGRHPLPSRSDWLDRVKQLGLTPKTEVVVYDDMGGASASRLWWMLRWIGHENVSVLSGGLQAWIKNDGNLSQKLPPPTRPSDTDYSKLEPLTKMVSAEEIDTNSQLVIDAREHERFEGKHEMIDPIAGHIPGAVCIPYKGSLTPGGNFRPKPDLQQRFASCADNSVVCYCGSGVTACHNILSIVHAGYEEPALYPGSWSEWIVGGFRPVATGSE